MGTPVHCRVRTEQGANEAFIHSLTTALQKVALAQRTPTIPKSGGSQEFVHMIDIEVKSPRLFSTASSNIEESQCSTPYSYFSSAVSSLDEDDGSEKGIDNSTSSFQIRAYWHQMKEQHAFKKACAPLKLTAARPLPKSRRLHKRKNTLSIVTIVPEAGDSGYSSST